MIAYWWVPVVFIIYTLQGIVSVKNNQLGGWWFYAMWAFGAIPLWAVVSRFSKNITFDAVLFDMLLFAGFYIGILAWGAAQEKLTPLNWTGIALALIGMVLLKVK